MEFREEAADDFGIGADLTFTECGILALSVFMIAGGAACLHHFIQLQPSKTRESQAFTLVWRAAGVVVTGLVFQWLINANRTGCGALVESDVTINAVSELSASDFLRDSGLFYKHKAAGVPVVVRGLLSEEVASGLWTPASLAEEFRGHSVNVA